MKRKKFKFRLKDARGKKIRKNVKYEKVLKNNKAIKSFGKG
jgi:hypothetical protein